jgi:hypothetical protein
MCRKENAGNGFTWEKRMIIKFKATENLDEIALTFFILFLSYNQLIIDRMSGSNWSIWCNSCIIISILLSLCLIIKVEHSEDDSWIDQLSEPMKRRKIWD